jgi:hypothetical protein
MVYGEQENMPTVQAFKQRDAKKWSLGQIKWAICFLL